MNTRLQSSFIKYFNRFLLSWVKIAETQTSYRIPNFVYVVFQMIYFTQALSNAILTSPQDQDRLTQILVAILKSTIYVDYLYDIQSQTAVWITYTIAHLVVYFLYLFAIYLGYVRYKQSATAGRSFHKIYYKVHFYKPFMKPRILYYLSISMVYLFPFLNQIQISGPYTLIFSSGQEDIFLTNTYGFILGAHGCLLVIVLQIITILFFRNFEYYDQNSFKRKHSAVQFITLILKILIILTFVSNAGMYTSQVLSLLFGLSSIYDALVIRPFFNKTIAQSYIITSLSYTSIIILHSAREYGYFNDKSLIIMSVCFCPLMSQIGLEIYETIYMKTLLIQQTDDEKNFKQLPLYLEQILRLQNQAIHSEEANMLLHIVFRSHVLSCNNTECFSYQLQIKTNDRFNYNLKLLIMLVDQTFKQALSNRAVQKNINQYETISFKYISYIQKYLHNSLLSYYYLKKLGRQKPMSYYYSLLFEVYSDKLKHQLRLINIGLQNNTKLESRGSEGLKFFTECIQQVEDFTIQLSQNLVQVISNQQLVWQSTRLSSNTMDDLLGRVSEQVKTIHKIRLQILDEFSISFGHDHKIQHVYNAGYLKLRQMYELFVLNDVIEVLKLEKQVTDLRKRDQYKEEAYLNNHNFMNGQSVIIQAGLSIQNGKILNRDNNKIPQFFGFNENDWAGISTINDLMPRHISILHNQILATYLSKGFSPLMTTARKIFLLNKENFLFPVSISVRNDYKSQNDCVFNVTLLKISNNRELIMFDEFGKIIGLSMKLYQMITGNPNSDSASLEYKYIRDHGYMQLLFPAFVKVFDQVREEIKYSEALEEVMALTIQNLQSTLLLSLDFKDLAKQYSQNVLSKHKDLSLLNESQSRIIQNFIIQNRECFLPQHISQRLRLRFSLHAFYRSFAEIDDKILRSLTSSTQKVSVLSSMRYFVVECYEIHRLRTRTKRRFGLHMKTMKDSQIDGDVDPTTGELEQIVDDISQLEDSKESIEEDLIKFDIEYKDESLSEMKDPLSFKIVSSPLNERMSNEEDVMTKRSQIQSLSSPRGSQIQILFKSGDELDSRKKTFLMKMLDFQRKKFELNYQAPQSSHEDDMQWPSSLDDFTKVNPQREERNQNNNSMQDDGADSENDFEEEDRISRINGLDKSKSKKEAQTEVKRDRREIESTQNSKGTGGSLISITYMYLQQKRPSQYFNFKLSIFSLYLTVSLYTLIQLINSSQGLSQLDNLANQIDTAYILQSGYTKGTTGVILQHLDQLGALRKNLTALKKLDQEALFQKYQYDGIMQLIDIINKRFSLLNSVQHYFDINEINVIKFYDQTVERLNGLLNDSNLEYSIKLTQGIQTDYVITSSINQLINKKIETQESSLLNTFQIVFYASFVAVLLEILFTIQKYRTFLQYKEKMLLIFTRINLNEFEKELLKLDYGRQMLKDSKGSTIVTQDFVMSYLQFQKKKHTQVQEDETDERQSAKKATGHIQSQIMSSRIYYPFLSIRRYAFQFSFMGLILIIYLLGAIIFAIQIPASLAFIRDYYLKYSNQFLTIQQIMIYTEIKGAKPFIVNQPQDLGDFQSFTQFEEYYSGLLQSLNQFTSQDKVFTIQESQNAQVISLLYNDLCLSSAEIPQRNTLDLMCQTDLKGFYKNGIIGMIKNLLILFYSYQDQINSNSNLSQQASEQFLSLNENWVLLILFPDTFSNAIDSVLSMIKAQLIEVTDTLGSDIIIYLIVTGVLISILMLIYFNFMFRELNERVMICSYLLTMIPFDKLQEPTILQMIKQLQAL